MLRIFYVNKTMKGIYNQMRKPSKEKSLPMDRTSKDYIKKVFDVITENKIKGVNYETELECIGYIYTVKPILVNLLRIAFESITVLNDDTVESYQTKILSSIQANDDKLNSKLLEPTFDCFWETYFK